MNESLRDWDFLLHRYLEGTIGTEESAALNARLKEDPELAKRLAEMSVDALQLRDLGAGEVLEPVQGDSVPLLRPSWPKGPIAAAAAILLAVLVAILARPSQQAPPGADGGEPTAPPGVEPTATSWIDEVDGFGGRVMGRIVKREGRNVRLSIQAVTSPSGNAQVPEALIGREVRIVPGTVRDDESDARRDPIHDAFLRRVPHGHPVTVEIFHVSEDVFRLGTLDRIYVDWARPGRGDVEGRREGDREGDEGRRREGGERTRERDPVREGAEQPEQRRRRGDGDEGDREQDNRRRGREGDREGRSNREDR